MHFGSWATWNVPQLHPSSLPPRLMCLCLHFIVTFLPWDIFSSVLFISTLFQSSKSTLSQSRLAEIHRHHFFGFVDVMFAFAFFHDIFLLVHVIDCPDFSATPFQLRKLCVLHYAFSEVPTHQCGEANHTKLMIVHCTIFTKFVAVLYELIMKFLLFSLNMIV